MSFTENTAREMAREVTKKVYAIYIQVDRVQVHCLKFMSSAATGSTVGNHKTSLPSHRSLTAWT